MTSLAELLAVLVSPPPLIEAALITVAGAEFATLPVNGYAPVCPAVNKPVGVLLSVMSVPGAPPAARNAATAAPHWSVAPSVAVAETGPALACRRSAAINFVLGAAGTRSSMTKPLPAVNVAGLPVEMRPRIKSPLDVVVNAPELGVALVP